MQRTWSRRIILLVVFLFFGAAARADGWTWPTTFTGGSSPDLTKTQWSLVNATMKDPGVPVHGVTIRAEGFELAMESGTIWVEPALDGAQSGAYFEGVAKVSFTPTAKRAGGQMTYWFGHDKLDATRISRAFVFAPGDGSLLERLGIADVASVPWTGSTEYDELKKAFRQLGMGALTAFVDRNGRGKNSMAVLFAIDATRDGRSSDGLVLYTFDPSQRNTVMLWAAGYEMVDNDPNWKYYFHPLVTQRSAARPWQAQASVAAYTSRFDMSKRMGQLDLQTTIRFTPVADVRYLMLTLNPRMKVSAVKGSSGPLPFAQWGWVADGVNPDNTVVVDLGSDQRAGVESSIEVTASGKIFDPFWDNWVLVDEDTWFPQLDDPEGSMHQMTVVVPKNMVPVAPGKKVSDEVAGGDRTVRYETVRPQRHSTLYVGPFEKIEGEAEGTKVEVYSDRSRGSSTMVNDPSSDGLMSVTVRGTSKNDIDYSRQEIENALNTYKKILGPIDLEMLRVASTPTGHGRGFEGLLLLSKFGGFESDSSFADLFRAHEVAHLWWGGVVEPLDWREDRWLGESFAEYSAMEFYAIRFQKPEKTREMIQQQWVRPILNAPQQPVSTLDGQKRRVRASELRPLADGTQNVYTKGPLVLHMLRNLFVLFKGNDQMFWELLQDFLEQNKGKKVTTQDFIAATEKKLGGKIDWFWDAWLYGSDIPRVRWSSTQVLQGEQWVVTVDAKQEGTAFQLPIPVYVDLGDKRRLRQYLNLSGPTGRAVIKCPQKPKSVSLNDNYEVLAFIEKE